MHGRIGRQKMLAEIYKECGSIFGKGNTTMTDKQIIIDEVDVSECIFHSLTTMGYVGYNYCKCFECVCECYNDCYYKQLKRKEQELEQYKASKQASYEELQKKCNELELENRTLAREILKLNSAVDFITLTEHSAINKYNKLKQTLTEIKEIAEEIDDECEYSCFASCAKKAKKQILNKISEVLDESN